MNDERQRCACGAAGCRAMAEPGQPYALTHDRRPEMQEARRARFSQMGKDGSAKVQRNRAALRADMAKKLSADTPANRKEVINVGVRSLARARMDDAKRWGAIGALLKVAHDIDVDDLERNTKRLEKLIDKGAGK